MSELLQDVSYCRGARVVGGVPHTRNLILQPQMALLFLPGKLESITTAHRWQFGV